MNLLQDIITYIRRIIKAPSNTSITDDLLIDYINRFWIMDVDARLQLFDLKTKYQFQTQPGVDQYNMPLYSVQTESGNQTIGMYPVYQGFLGPCYINGVSVAFQTQKENFFNIGTNGVQNLSAVAIGDGGPTYTIQLPILANSAPSNPPFQGLLRGHIDISGIIDLGLNVDPPIQSSLTAQTSIPQVKTTSVLSSVYFTSLDATGANVIVADSGQFLASNINYGLLMSPGNAPNGNSPLNGGYSLTSNTINYFTGSATFTFPRSIPLGVNINAQCYYFTTGLPRGMLFYNNTLTLRSPPDRQYLVELDAYLSPAAMLNSSNGIQFGYMTEYLARGAARKILSDTGDAEQMAFYEPLFLEQEKLVHIRSQRQWTSTRTQTIYSQGMNNGNGSLTNNGTGTL